jgi:protein-L-isoaspartate(D-aspartate) O-methyltransferase
MITRREILTPLVTCVLVGCWSQSPAVPADDQTAVGGESVLAQRNYDDQRAAMVNQQMRRRDITDPSVLSAMEKVPRHEFVPKELRGSAYTDGPLPIGKGQTISQPYIVALMTQLARPKPDSRVLDVGTGSGYQAAVLAEIVDQVYSIEIVESLADEARERLKRLGYENIEVRSGDGYRGWPEHAPFDLIIVAAAPDHIPQPLIDQLAAGGRLIIPVGKYFQSLMLVEKKADGSVEKTNVAPVAFVPMTGQARNGR